MNKLLPDNYLRERERERERGRDRERERDAETEREREAWGQCKLKLVCDIFSGHPELADIRMSGRRSIQSAFGQSTANDVGGNY